MATCTDYSAVRDTLKVSLYMCAQVDFELTCATSLFLLFPSLSELHKSAMKIVIFKKIIIIVIVIITIIKSA